MKIEITNDMTLDSVDIAKRATNLNAASLSNVAHMLIM